MNTDDVIYDERQRFRSPWLWGILLPTTGMFFYGMIGKVFYQIPFLIDMPTITLFLITSLLLMLAAVFYFLEMETVVKEEGIYLSFSFYNKAFKFIPFSDVAAYKAVTYNPIEKGGRGICDSKDCYTYSVSGKNAIEFTLLSGKKLLVGTSDPEDFMHSLNRMRIVN